MTVADDQLEARLAGARRSLSSIRRARARYGEQSRFGSSDEQRVVEEVAALEAAVAGRSAPPLNRRQRELAWQANPITWLAEPVVIGGKCRIVGYDPLVVDPATIGRAA